MWHIDYVRLKRARCRALLLRAEFKGTPMIPYKSAAFTVVLCLPEVSLRPGALAACGTFDGTSKILCPCQTSCLSTWADRLIFRSNYTHERKLFSLISTTIIEIAPHAAHVAP